MVMEATDTVLKQQIDKLTYTEYLQHLQYQDEDEVTRHLHHQPPYLPHSPHHSTHRHFHQRRHRFSHYLHFQLHFRHLRLLPRHQCTDYSVNSKKTNSFQNIDHSSTIRAFNFMISPSFWVSAASIEHHTTL